MNGPRRSGLKPPTVGLGHGRRVIGQWLLLFVAAEPPHCHPTTVRGCTNGRGRMMVIHHHGHCRHCGHDGVIASSSPLRDGPSSTRHHLIVINHLFRAWRKRRKEGNGKCARIQRASAWWNRSSPAVLALLRNISIVVISSDESIRDSAVAISDGLCIHHVALRVSVGACCCGAHHPTLIPAGPCSTPFHYYQPRKATTQSPCRCAVSTEATTRCCSLPSAPGWAPLNPPHLCPTGRRLTRTEPPSAATSQPCARCRLPQDVMVGRRGQRMQSGIMLLCMYTHTCAVLYIHTSSLIPSWSEERGRG